MVKRNYFLEKNREKKIIERKETYAKNNYKTRFEAVVFYRLTQKVVRRDLKG